MKKKQRLDELVRAAVKNGGISQYAFQNRHGIPHRVVGKFLAGKDVRLKTASDILDAMKITVRLERKE